MARMVYAAPFLQDLAQLDERREALVWEKLSLIEAFPGVGSSLVEPSLMRAFGEAILKVSATGYDVLYERHGDTGNETVHVLGLIPQRAVR